MRCPKCQYISFDSGERCRNCGYEFSFSTDEPPVDVTIGRDEPRSGRLDEVSFTALDAPLGKRSETDRDRTGDIALSDSPGKFTAGDLPLFSDRIADDQAPLVTAPAVPRPPLSVRRAHPGVRSRSRHQTPEELSLDLGTGGAARTSIHEQDEGDDVAPRGTAGIVRRFAAGLIDVMILGAIEVTVVYLTLRACDLTPEQWRVLPWIPLAAFMLLLCGGYFVLFTAAGGQTIGKMCTRIRVVAVPPDGDGGRPVSFSAAATRTIALFGSVAALGAGFLPVVLSSDRRAFHDRVAQTRVVSA
jgi:uncharacterized RDD family membrane protein YckC